MTVGAVVRRCSAAIAGQGRIPVGWKRCVFTAPSDPEHFHECKRWVQRWCPAYDPSLSRVLKTQPHVEQFERLAPSTALGDSEAGLNQELGHFAPRLICCSSTDAMHVRVPIGAL